MVTISRLEQGLNDPDTSTTSKIAAALAYVVSAEKACAGIGLMAKEIDGFDDFKDALTASGLKACPLCGDI